MDKFFILSLGHAGYIVISFALLQTGAAATYIGWPDEAMDTTTERVHQRFPDLVWD